MVVTGAVIPESGQPPWSSMASSIGRNALDIQRMHALQPIGRFWIEDIGREGQAIGEDADELFAVGCVGELTRRPAIGPG